VLSRAISGQSAQLTLLKKSCNTSALPVSNVCSTPVLQQSATADPTSNFIAPTYNESSSPGSAGRYTMSPRQISGKMGSGPRHDRLVDNQLFTTQGE
jgi:hypothetical protein